MKELKEFSDLIKCEHIELRFLKPSFENAKMLYDAYRAERPEYFKYYGDMDEIAKSPEQIFLDLDGGINLSKNYKQYGIFKNDKFIGCVNVSIFNRKTDEVALGIWLKEKESVGGLKYMFEATSALENEFWHNGVNRINYQCDINNHPSIKLAEKLGYKFEGISCQVLAYEKGRLGDAKNYSKLKSDIKK